MSKTGRLTSRPTEDKALGAWQRTGCHTRPIMFDYMPAQQREEMLNRYKFGCAIRLPAVYFPELEGKMKLHWTTVCGLDENGLTTKTAPAEVMAQAIEYANTKRWKFDLFVIG